MPDLRKRPPLNRESLYKAFSGERVESQSGQAPKSELIRAWIMAERGELTLQDLVKAFPTASSQLIRKVLSQLKSEGKISLTGRGRGAKWRVN